MDKRICAKCRAVLSASNPGTLCRPCQEKRAEAQRLSEDDLYYDVEDLRIILGLESEEQVRRLNRAGRLPTPIPARRKLLWPKKSIEDWIKSAHRVPAALGKDIEALLAAHGGIYYDDLAGQPKWGKQETISVLVYAKNKDGKVRGKTETINVVIPEHYQE